MPLFDTINLRDHLGPGLRKWLADTGVRTLYIEPGSPWENGYCESFHSKLRNEFLHGEIVYSIQELRLLVEGWRVHIPPDCGGVTDSSVALH